MKVEIRKTISGTEYWDTEAKKTLFVPNGKKPKFEVSEETKELISKKEHVGEFVGINIDDMNAEKLLSFAEHNGINVPGNMKKEDTIRKHIAEQLPADEE